MKVIRVYVLKLGVVVVVVVVTTVDVVVVMETGRKNSKAPEPTNSAN